MPNLQQITDTIERANEVRDLVITDELGQPYTGRDGVTPATIGVVGVDSRHYRDTSEARSREVAKLPAVQRDTIDWRIENVCHAVVRWSGWYEGESDLPCTRAQVARALAATHILTQVAAGIDEHARFFATRSTS